VKNSLLVALVCVGFPVLHVRSFFGCCAIDQFGLVGIFEPLFIVMHWQGINANIMSLGGIAIANWPR